jgi:type II secretory pathway pseudopilin PulG
MEKRATNDMKQRDHARSLERGFTILQLLIVIGVIGIVSTFALISMARSRDSLRLQNSVRQLAGYMEKARLDSIRRHATGVTGSELASIVFTDTTTYTVTMDFDGTGTVRTRTFTLESGVWIISTPLPSVSFNWRGRTSACTFTFALQNSGGDQSWVDVSDAGDVTVNSDVDVLPSVSYGTVNTTSDVASGTVVSGTGVHNNTADCGGGGGGSVTPPPITGNGTACSMTASVSSLTVKKGGGSTGSVTLSTTGTGTYTISAAGPTNLQISPTSKTVAAGGSQAFSVKSLNNTRGTFAVTFSSSCTTVTVAVKVTN